ncbi:MAG: PEP-CTERM sorting domain-containing protein [Pirellulales bacterium]|nr:PEP-CTERM sorting domain-containing protein [Pirellulales bacterium]
MLRNLATYLVVFAVVFMSAAIASAEFVAVTDLGVPAGFTISGAHGFNGNGDVIVQSGTTVNSFLWSGGTYTNLGNLGYNMAYPRGIDDNGMVTGTAYLTSSQYHAFRWTADGGMVDMGTLKTDNAGNSRAFGIAEVGGVLTIVGDTANSTSYQHAFMWTAAGGMVDIGTLGRDSYAYAINDSGSVAGLSKDGSGVQYGFFYDGAMTKIDPISSYTSSIAYGMNNNDVVVGNSSKTGYTHAIKWDETGGTVDLGILTGGQEYSAAESINDLGQVAGLAKDSAGAYRAVMWNADGTIVDLNSLIDPASGWVLQWAKKIDDSGMITGWGLKDGVQHAFLMTIPEPSTFALLIAGLIGLLAYAWRKRK